MAKKIKLKKTKKKSEEDDSFLRLAEHIITDGGRLKPYVGIDKPRKKRRLKKKTGTAKKIPLAKTKGDDKEQIRKTRRIKMKFVETIKEVKSSRFGRVIIKESIKGDGAICRTADSSYSAYTSHYVSHISWFLKEVSLGKFEIYLPTRGDPESGRLVGVVKAVFRRGENGSVRRWRLKDKTYSTKRIFAAIAYHLYKLIELNEINVSTKWFSIVGPTTRYLAGDSEWKSYATLPTDEK